MKPFTPLLLLVYGGLAYTVGDLVFKKWALTNKHYLFGLGLAIYMVGSTLLAFSFRQKNIAAASVMIVVFNVITLALISWFYFKEELTPNEIIGIILGLIGVAVLEWKS